MHPKEKVRVLLADDDSVDRELFIEAMSISDHPFSVDQVGNGKELIDYLQTCTRYPDFILLDLNMPIMDGREVLKLIKKNPKFQLIPVFILSTSNAHHDVSNCYKSGANLYFVKPADFKELVAMQKHLIALFASTIAKPEFAA